MSDCYRGLLSGLLNDGKLKARTKWKEVFPLFASYERYLNVRGNPGSNPLELIWDVIDSLDQKLDAKVSIAEESFRRSCEKCRKQSGSGSNGVVAGAQGGKGTPALAFTADTTEQEMRDVLSEDSDNAARKLKDGDIKAIYDLVRVFTGFFSKLSFSLSLAA